MDVESLPNEPLHPRKVKCHIKWHDAQAIADMVSETRCTEKDACITLGINHLSWYQFKDKAKNRAKWSELFTRVRESAIAGLLKDVKRISDGDSSIKLKPDWRAKEFLLKVRAPERFNFNQIATPDANGSTPINLDALKRAFAAPINDFKPLVDVSIPNEEIKSLNPIVETSDDLTNIQQRAIPPRKRPADCHPQPVDEPAK